MAKAPTCLVCGKEHWSTQPCPALKAVTVRDITPARKPIKSHSVTDAVNKRRGAVNKTAAAVNRAAPAVNKKRGRYPATDDRRAYMRDYMRRKRAKADA